MVGWVLPAVAAAALLAFSPGAVASRTPIKISPGTTINFGTQPVGTTTSRSVTLTNTSSEPVHVSGMGVSSSDGAFEFDFSSDTCVAPELPDGILAPGASCSYTILFTPTHAGRNTGQSDIEADGNATFLKLSGRGT